MPRILTVILLFIAVELQSQSALFLLISPVTSLNGMGEIGVGLPYEDHGSVYYNPANGFINSSSLSGSESSMRTKWLPGLVDDMVLEHDHFRVSYALSQYPLRFNLHQYETYLDAGLQQYTDANGLSLGTFQTWFKANALVLAAQYTGTVQKIPLDISLGIASKQIKQHLTDEDHANNVVFDRGFLIGVPLKLKLKNDLMLNLEPSVGMSTVNIGSSVVFNKGEQEDPLPTAARAGVGITASVPLSEKWNLFQYRAGNAAMDILEEPRTSGDQPIEYQKGLGDIKFYKHVIMSDPDEDPERGHDVVITRGHELSFLDVFSIRFGDHVDIAGKVVTPQSGISYNSQGLLSLAYYMTNIHLIDVINRHVEISYSYAEWTAGDTHPLSGTNFESWNVTVKDIFGINNSLQSTSSPTALKLKDAIAFSLGVNYPLSEEGGSGPENTWQKSAGYTAGVETDLKYFRLGFSLTQSSFAYDDEDFWEGFLRADVRDEVYQLALNAQVPFTVGNRITLLGGLQVQSPLLHRKVTLFDQTIDVTSYEYNYGLRAGAEVKIVEYFSLRGSYSYWQQDIESLFNADQKVKLSGFVVEGLIKL
ncbi:MAG: outer membrane beta-barrel protein [Candidatus Marinimicrobia bacterium]|nr:outer membrane beta-barrel protein [Candidatus Neomarinimicrobiota bacterium]